MRNNKYLEQKLQDIFKKYFSDIPIKNNVHICFGKKAKKRLGSIRERYVGKKSSDFDTLILINGHFRDKYIPEVIIDATIAHELCHYAHGFASPLPQLSRFPHRGGAVDKEMVRRGIGELVLQEQNWLDKNWINYLSNS